MNCMARQEFTVQPHCRIDDYIAKYELILIRAENMRDEQVWLLWRPADLQEIQRREDGVCRGVHTIIQGSKSGDGAAPYARPR